MESDLEMLPNIDLWPPHACAHTHTKQHTEHITHTEAEKEQG